MATTPAKKSGAKNPMTPDSDATWKPTAEAKKKATTLRIVAIVLWVVAIAGEAVGIFWLLRQRQAAQTAADTTTLERDPETGLLVQGSVDYEFPQWALITLIVLMVVIAALSITGSFLWKKANRLDPASKKDTVRFFVQNQLGAIIAIVAFLPLIIMVFLNKDMSKGQKSLAGIVGIVLAVAAVALGIDFNPSSTEQYTADRSAVVQLLGEDHVYWVAGGSVYHVCNEVSDIQNASTEQADGTTSEAVAAGKNRLTLELRSELNACGLPVPENVDEIVDALRSIQGGDDATLLPQPVYADGVTPPLDLG
ncbi:hypothetical protein [Homoserinibacter gongjuensis]|jgi:hypothetical protein|uniref:MFS transporter n=1 Tax=Homoserinibacter gongjuensis TaxID=1162968 RepID=A0ABQ6JU19_9MICO|nr:hypothetical protein [Homoserinibacter gongjuensis]GMA91673.1 hypothetical protein GCM10025869_22020 [Homoserinibacter gongjuensis]